MSHTVDISDERVIQTMLADPANYCWRAVDCEMLDGWTPDLGLTHYIRPSIYRPRCIPSGVRTEIRHRFHGNAEGMDPAARGKRWIGVVARASRDLSPLEITLGSVRVGQIKPQATDQRLHLFALDHPIEVVGGMEVLRITADAGTWRIEHIVLLGECPIPRRIPFQVHDPLVGYASQLCGDKKRLLAFSTSRPGKDPDCTDPFAQPHVLHCRSAEAQAEHRVVDDDGKQLNIPVDGVTLADATLASEPLSIPLELCGSGHHCGQNMPLRFGVPIRQKAIQGLATGQLIVESVAVDAQLQPVAYWPDGSVKWMHVYCVTPIPIAADAIVPAALRMTPDSQRQSVPTHVTHKDFSCGNWSFQINPGTDGQWVFRMGRSDKANATQWFTNANGSNCIDVAVELANGVQLKTIELRDLTVNQPGPSALTIQFKLLHADSAHVVHVVSHLEIDCRVSDTPVLLRHRCEIVSPCLLGKQAWPDCHRTAPVLGDRDDAKQILLIKSIELVFPFQITNAVALDASLNEATNLTIEQIDERSAIINRDGVTHRCASVADLKIKITGKITDLNVSIAHFAQKYPKRVELTREVLRIGLLSANPLTPLGMGAAEDEATRFWLTANACAIKSGMSLSNAISIGLPAQDEQGVGALHAPFVRPTVQYLNQTQAWWQLTPKASSPATQYESLSAALWESFRGDQRAVGAFGQINFGDWFGESGHSWGNNEYDPAFCGYVDFLRGGPCGWAGWAADAARHTADIDTINFAFNDDQRGAQVVHMPGHVAGYFPPFHKSKIAHNLSLPSHTWVEGQLLHWLLTGDHAVGKSLQLTRQWLLRPVWFDNCDPTDTREPGWHIIHLCAFAKALSDVESQAAAGVIVRRMLERRTPNGAWERSLGAAHCGCGYPRCMGEAGLMVGLLIAGLGRYYQLTHAPEVARAIVDGANWIIDKTYDPVTKMFRYTSCPNRRPRGHPNMTLLVLEALACAWEISGDQHIGQHTANALSVVANLAADPKLVGIGKAYAQQMRYVPQVLVAIHNRALPQLLRDQI